MEIPSLASQGHLDHDTSPLVSDNSDSDEELIDSWQNHSEHRVSTRPPGISEVARECVARCCDCCCPRSLAKRACVCVAAVVAIVTGGGIIGGMANRSASSANGASLPTDASTSSLPVTSQPTAFHSTTRRTTTTTQAPKPTTCPPPRDDAEVRELEEQCRKEWKDLKAAHGGKPVSSASQPRSDRGVNRRARRDFRHGQNKSSHHEMTQQSQYCKDTEGRYRVDSCMEFLQTKFRTANCEDKAESLMEMQNALKMDGPNVPGRDLMEMAEIGLHHEESLALRGHWIEIIAQMLIHGCGKGNQRINPDPVRGLRFFYDCFPKDDIPDGQQRWDYFTQHNSKFKPSQRAARSARR